MKRFLLFLSLAGILAAQTAQFPGAVVTDSQLAVAANNIEGTLTASATNTTTTFNVSSASELAPNMLLTLSNSEIVHVCSVNTGANTFNVGVSSCPNTDGRAFDGTSAVSHNSGDIFTADIDAWHHNSLRVEVEAIETQLGANMSGVSTTCKGVTHFPWACAADYNFTPQTPGGTISAGSNTITLTPCPNGVNGSDSLHGLYLSGGTGTAEAVEITGGTCTSGASSGTVIVTAANSHSGAWQVSSNSGGIEEAFYAGWKKIIMPALTTWTLESWRSQTTPTGTVIMGLDWTSSTIQCATGLSCYLYMGPKSAMFDIDVQATTSCVDGNTSQSNCPERAMYNEDTAAQPIIATPFMSLLVMNNSASGAAETAGIQCRIPSGGTGDCFYAETLAGSNATAIRAYNSSTGGAGMLVGRNNTGPGFEVNDVSGAATSGPMLSAFTSYKQTGNMLNLTQNTSTYTDTVVYLSLAQGSGSFTGKALTFTNNNALKYQIDSAGDTIQAGNLEFNATGAHVTPNAGQSDIGGVIAVSSSTSAAQNFATSFSSTPACSLTPLSDVGSGVRFWATSSTTAVTAHLSASGTVSFVYHCFGNPN